MSYRVNSSHVEALHDGRMVEPGASISDADAKKNPRLLERGVLEKEETGGKRKPPAQTTATPSAADSTVAADKEEESK